MTKHCDTCVFIEPRGSWEGYCVKNAQVIPDALNYSCDRYTKEGTMTLTSQEQYAMQMALSTLVQSGQQMALAVQELSNRMHQAHIALMQLTKVLQDAEN